MHLIYTAQLKNKNEIQNITTQLMHSDLQNTINYFYLNIFHNAIKIVHMSHTDVLRVVAGYMCS